MQMRFLILFLFISFTCIAQDTINDCNETEAPASWLGDGYCDNSQYSWGGNVINFNCEEFGYDNGDCPIPIDTLLGCMNMLALNFVPEANIDNGSCEFPVFGCTDPEAPNYNPWAQADDNSCVGVSCSDGEVKMILKLTLDQFPGETGWILTDTSNGQAVESVTAGEYSYEQANQTIIYDLCVPESGVELILSDTYGDGLEGSLYNGGTDGDFIILGDVEPCGSLDTLWALDTAGFGSAAYSGPIWLQQCDIPAIEGCTNNTYVEFNPQANLDNGSCETLHIIGCINPTMYNYNSEATLNYIIPTCNYTLIIEDDGGDGWGDCYIGVVQEDSILGTYTMGPGSYSQEFNIVLETDKPVKVYYFEIASPQTPPAEVAFQTMHNSFRLINSDDIVTLQGGVFPFADNGAGALQPYKPPFWNVYSALPFCGDYCEPIVYGCIYPTNEANPDIVMFNYNPEANTYDPEIDPCIPELEGCTDANMYGYNSNANIDDGSCVPWFIGCMDTLAWNYQPLANINDTESCLYFGCMDEAADNYDSMANVELEGACFTTVLGCTDPEAFNYNEEANTEDFSCIPFIYGCMDSTAFNYNSLANSEDECELIVEGCMDSDAYNYEIFANTEAECLYNAGCIDGPGNPYWLNDTCYAWVIMVDPYCCNNDWDEKCQQLYWSCAGDSELDTRDLLRGHDIVMYPNPMGDVLNILTNGSVAIKVHDITGKLVIKIKQNQTHKGLNQLDVSLLPTGIYNFSVTYNGSVSTTKLLKK